ncbi:protein of unknown function [Paraburkholderia kururiensis]
MWKTSVRLRLDGTRNEVKNGAEDELQRTSAEVSATSDARAMLPGRCCSDSVFYSET